jgi:hypothetical protein
MHIHELEREFILHQQLQRIASRHLHRLVLAKNRCKVVCDMAGELYDAFAAQRFKLVKNTVSADEFQGDARTYLSRVVMYWFQDVRLSDTEHDAIQAEVANRRHAWVAKAYSMCVATQGEPETPGALIRRFMEDEGYSIGELAKEMKVSREALSSACHGGNRHGRVLLIKLANRMGVDPKVLRGSGTQAALHTDTSH